ncbi:MAG: acetyltransferase [Gammaproteobacteria bacterium]|nr:acetyltransferase [Gammaproteobacteria bacterium]
MQNRTVTRKPPIVVFGAGGHALVVADILGQMDQYRIIGFLDDVNHERHGAKFAGASILGGSNELAALRADGVTHAIVAIGHCATRTRIAEMLVNTGFELVSAIHPRAYIAGNVEIGPGCVVAAQAAINPGSKLGTNVIVNTGATVDHECEIGAAAHIGPGVHLAGRVQVGERAWIGIGCCVSDRVRIGSDAFIGAGAAVVRDIPASMLAYGVPARVIGKVNE